MRRQIFISALTLLALVSCGGNQQGSSVATNIPPGPTGSAGVSSIVVLTNAATLPSDNSGTADISVYVRDATNKFLPNIPVTLSATSGGLTPVVTTSGTIPGTTDVNGVAKATLTTLGDPRNRTITVTAMVGTISGTATVNVVGTALSVQGPASLTAGQVQPYTITLSDAGAKGIPSTAITVTAPSNATVSATALTTDAQGRATVNVTGSAGGTGTLSVAGLGVTATTTIVVASDSLAFTSPAANSQVPLQTSQTVSVRWLSNGVGMANQPVNFSITRGCINPPGATCILTAGPPATYVSAAVTANTDGTGLATVQVLADNAGGAVVTATVAGGTVASIPLQFVATAPTTIDVQPSVFTVAASGTSTISAIVRDANNNLVANKTVVFNLTDVTGGSLSVASALTNLQGIAQTVYTASSVTSANNGVQITASVQGFPAVAPKTVALTVAGRQVFISIGTGNTISEPNPAQYQVPYIIQVTDSSGAGVAGVSLAMSVLSKQYFKGFRVLAGSGWGTSITATCADEDINHNGVLDAGEDFNNSIKIEAGNIAAVVPASILTDSSGFAQINIFYPQEYAYYLSVTLQALAQVTGTAYSAQSTFVLAGAAPDFNNATNAPPGVVSPFGQSNTCANTL
jgi:hypothetical protein